MFDVRLRAPARTSRPAPPARSSPLPGPLRAGAEALSGVDLSDVRVHANSPEPEAFEAHALARGGDIHVAPGQEWTLPHETWHLVQQRQGRVRAVDGSGVNAEAALEREADVMGGRAAGDAAAREPGAPPGRANASVLASPTLTAPVQLQKKSLRQRVRDKLRTQGAAHLTARERSLLAREPELQAHTVGRRLPRPTQAELVAGAQRLRQADYGVVHPDLGGIRARRGAGQSNVDYMRFVEDTRSSISRLASRPEGARMLTGLNARTAAVNPGRVGDEHRSPLTVADVRSGRGLAPDSQMSHRPRLDPAAPDLHADLQRGYRFAGRHGTGIASNVNYDESRAGEAHQTGAAGPRHLQRDPNRFVSLGHELVHAYRAAHGYAVNDPTLSQRRNDAVLHLPKVEDPNNPGKLTDPTSLVPRTIAHHAMHREEFETVGLMPTPRVGNSPTENLIRAEHGLPLRQDYSGARPGGRQDQNLRNVDQATDDRWGVQKLWGTRSPVDSIVHDLED
jgi:hypothetical protein